MIFAAQHSPATKLTEQAQIRPYTKGRVRAVRVAHGAPTLIHLGSCRTFARKAQVALEHRKGGQYKGGTVRSTEE